MGVRGTISPMKSRQERSNLIPLIVIGLVPLLLVLAAWILALHTGQGADKPRLRDYMNHGHINVACDNLWGAFIFASIILVPAGTGLLAIAGIIACVRHVRARR